MYKLNANDVVKIIWGDDDRLIAGNIFNRSIIYCKNIINKKTEHNNIRFSKMEIIKELRKHGFSCKDINYIRQIVSNAIKDEIFIIRKEFSIPSFDVFYSDETFSRYTLNSRYKPVISSLMNARARKKVEAIYTKSMYKLEYYN